MSEEIQNASTAVPQALLLSIGINGALGFSMLIATMFCLGDFNAALNSASGYAYIEIFQQAVGSAGGAAAMSSVIAALAICATVGTFAAATRLLWAFARDNGVPFAHFVGKVSTLLSYFGRTASVASVGRQTDSLVELQVYRGSSLPLNTVLITIIVSMLLVLISLGSPVALDDLVNLSIASLFASYLIVCLALLIRRLQGKVKAHDEESSIQGPDSLRWGPWHVPEPLGTMNNIFAVVFLTWTLFWTFWPETPNPSLKEMNWNVVVFFGTMILGIVWYFAVGHRSYRGPVMEFTD